MAALGPQQIGRIQFGLTEEGVAAVGLEVHQRTQDDARRRGRNPTDAPEVFLALRAGEMGDDRAQILQIQQAETRLIRPVENQPEG
jgi:hypothetical protein